VNFFPLEFFLFALIAIGIISRSFCTCR